MNNINPETTFSTKWIIIQTTQQFNDHFPSLSELADGPQKTARAFYTGQMFNMMPRTVSKLIDIFVTKTYYSGIDTW